MTTWPSSQTPDQSSTATMAAYIPQTVASRAATGFDVTAPTATRPPYVPDLAWSAEPPEFAVPLPTERPRSWFMRSGADLRRRRVYVAAAAAGIFGALDGVQSTPADTTAAVHLDLPCTRSGRVTRSGRATGEFCFDAWKAGRSRPRQPVRQAMAPLAQPASLNIRRRPR